MNVQAPATVEARTDRLVARMAERELDCLLVTNLHNVRYLTGFTGTNGACIVTPDERLFLTDFRYVEQVAEHVPPELDPLVAVHLLRGLLHVAEVGQEEALVGGDDAGAVRAREAGER